MGCTPIRSGTTSRTCPHRAAQRRGRRPPGHLPQHRVPRCGRNPRRNLGELGLRRDRAVLEGELRGPHAEPLHPGAQPACDRCHHRPGLRRAPPSASRSAARCSTATDPNCVPYNIFDTRQATDAGRAATTCRRRRSRAAGSTSRSTPARVTGDLGGIGLQSPFASESIQVARRASSAAADRVEFVPDLLLADAGHRWPGRPRHGR